MVCLLDLRRAILISIASGEKRFKIASQQKELFGRFPPTLVACFCIHLACKWSNYKIPLSAQNKEWFVYVDPSATLEMLDELAEEFLAIYEKCPSRLKKKIKASSQAVSGNQLPSLGLWLLALRTIGFLFFRYFKR
jgi:hypothetical protein